MCVCVCVRGEEVVEGATGLRQMGSVSAMTGGQASSASSAHIWSPTHTHIHTRTRTETHTPPSTSL